MDVLHIEEMMIIIISYFVTIKQNGGNDFRGDNF
jgi:hypothetical protein